MARSSFFETLSLSILLWLALAATFVLPCEHVDEKKIPGHCRPHPILRNRCKKEKSNKNHKGISQELLDDFRLMSQYCAASYVPWNTNSSDTLLSCSGMNCINVPNGNCPLVEKAKAKTAMEFKDTPHFDDHGFIAIDPTNKLVVLSFRGSHSKQNWFEDIKLLTVCSDLCDTCYIHRGFWHSWTSMRDMIFPNVIAATKTNPDYRFIVTGHSLGAALATIAAADFRRTNAWLFEHTELFTFGSPRIGPVSTAEFLTNQSNKTYRITAMGDPIPRVPGPFLGYMHTSPEYWISKNPQNPKKEDVHVLTGYYNRGGNTGTTYKTFNDHRQYFGYVTKCDPDPPGDPEEKSWWRFLVEAII